MRKLRFWVAAAALSLAGSTLAQTTAPSPAPVPADPAHPPVPVARVEPVDLNTIAPAHHSHRNPSKSKKAVHKSVRKPVRHPRRKRAAKH